MKLHELAPVAGSTQEGKRKGRGVGTGNGKTGGRGHKGQHARSGGKTRVGFEGGQMPLVRRVPKRGFINVYAKPLTAINLTALNRFEDGAVVDLDALMAAVAQKYGIVVRGEDDEAIGYRLELDDFAVDRMMDRFEVSSQKRGTQYIIGAMLKEVKEDDTGHETEAGV